MTAALPIKTSLILQLSVWWDWMCPPQFCWRAKSFAGRHCETLHIVWVRMKKTSQADVLLFTQKILSKKTRNVYEHVLQGHKSGCCIKDIQYTVWLKIKIYTRYMVSATVAAERYYVFLTRCVRIWRFTCKCYILSPICGLILCAARVKLWDHWQAN